MQRGKRGQCFQEVRRGLERRPWVQGLDNLVRSGVMHLGVRDKPRIAVISGITTGMWDVRCCSAIENRITRVTQPILTHSVVVELWISLTTRG